MISVTFVAGSGTELTFICGPQRFNVLGVTFVLWVYKVFGMVNSKMSIVLRKFGNRVIGAPHVRINNRPG